LRDGEFGGADGEAVADVDFGFEQAFDGEILSESAWG
jgi:hypothetical protein